MSSIGGVQGGRQGYRGVTQSGGDATPINASMGEQWKTAAMEIVGRMSPEQIRGLLSGNQGVEPQRGHLYHLQGGAGI